MDVMSFSRFLQLLFFLGCDYILHISECLSISASYGQNNAVFTCVIDPYTGTQRWFIDSVAVTDCGAISCIESVSNPARYSFTHNTTSGIFTFKIDPISSTDEGRIIDCFNGANTLSLKLSTVKDSSKEDENNDIGSKIGIGVGVSVGTLLIAAVAGVMIWRHIKSKVKPPEMPKVDVIMIGITEIEIKCQMNPAFKYLVSCKRFKERYLTDNHFKIDDLLPDETYEIYVHAVTKGVYSSPWSRKIHTETILTPNLVKMTPSACTCKIEWTVPPFPGDSQLEYTLQYCEWENETEWKKQGIIKETETLLQSLQPSTSYKIRVYAIYKSKVLGPCAKTFKTNDLEEGANDGMHYNRTQPTGSEQYQRKRELDYLRSLPETEKARTRLPPVAAGNSALQHGSGMMLRQIHKS